MALDPRYVCTYTLEEYFVDKDTGAPLAGGTVQFWQDNNRTTPKLVYELTGAPPNYTYTALPNPITLSAVGTLADNSGANIPIYYFPYDSFDTDANVQLYYVVVLDSNGNVQFTRQGWPNFADTGSGPTPGGTSSIVNQISNPQFADVLFNPEEPLTISFTGSGNMNVDIAPDWQLQINYTGTGTVTVTRNSVVGSSAYPTNPPYTLSITAGTNIADLQLVQRLPNNPDIWSPQPGGQNGYVSANILLAPLSSTTISYVPSTGVEQVILTANNTSGAYNEFQNTVQLSDASNPDNADIGYVDIVIDLAVSGTTTIGSIQIVGLEGNDTNVVYEQTPVNRQIDQLFHYYNPLLSAKPISSYLVGWDFPVNPAQFYGPTVSAFASGSNTSNYVWDQTIVFQTVNSGLTFSRSATEAFAVTGAATGQFALVQYVDLPTAIQLLNQRLSVNVSASTSIGSGVSGKVSLWYTAGGSLPNIASNASLIATLDATGKPSTFNGTWTEVTRSNLGDAVFTIEQSATDNFNDYPLSGWDLMGATAIETVTFFAIVIGLEAINNGDVVEFNSISLVPGDIATRPAPKTQDETLFECQRFYEKSYATSTTPGTATSVNALTAIQNSTVTSPGGVVLGLSGSFTIEYKNNARVANPTVTLYSDNSGTSAKVYYHGYYNGSLQSATDATLSTYWTVANAGSNSISYNGTNGSGIISPNVGTGTLYYTMQTWISYHYVKDARLGIV